MQVIKETSLATVWNVVNKFVKAADVDKAIMN